MSAADSGVDVLMITHRRPHYTERSLERLLDAADESMRIWVWHNGDHLPTIDVVQRFADHPRMARLRLNDENVGLRDPTNWIWNEGEGELVGKVDDDCLVPHGWADRLRAAHATNPRLGVVGLWLYRDEDYIPQVAQRKIVQLNGGHQILRNSWVQGSGYLMKRDCIDQVGVLLPDDNFTRYCVRLSENGWTNGFYFPFVHEDHMDDPRSPNTMLRTDEDLRQFLPLSARTRGIDDLSTWEQHIRFGGFVLQHWPAEARPLGGWRGRTRRTWTRLMYRKWQLRQRVTRQASSG